MQLGQYQREHEELTRFIQNLIGDRTIIVSKIFHGNHTSQVHILLRKQLNESTTTDSFPLFLELGTVISSGMNVYKPVIIKDIKKNLSKETIQNHPWCISPIVSIRNIGMLFLLGGPQGQSIVPKITHRLFKRGINMDKDQQEYKKFSSSK